MKLAPIGIAALAIASAAGASVVTVGGGYAESCYEAAEAQNVDSQALELCDRALAEEALVAGDRVATHVNRGIIYLRRRNLAEANADFDRALSLNPNEPEAWLNKAILTARYGNSRDAMPFVEKALQSGTRRPAVAYFVRAMAHEESGDIKAAYFDLQKARRLAPKWKEPVAELSRFQVRRP